VAAGSDVFEIVGHLGKDPRSGVYVKRGCGEDALRKLQAAARQHLGEEVPESYIRLLRLTNGLQINGAYFKEAENLVLENLDVTHPEIIVLGNSGNVVEYVFDKRDRRFHTINMGFPDERFASFQTFEEMLSTVLTEQQVG
jgi:hypothetical protein